MMRFSRFTLIPELIQLRIHCHWDEFIFRELLTTDVGIIDGWGAIRIIIGHLQMFMISGILMSFSHFLNVCPRLK
jgi:hypothetical protein